jgi:hypothetical protein
VPLLQLLVRFSDYNRFICGESANRDMDKRIFAVLFVVMAAFFGSLLFYVYTAPIPLGIGIGSTAIEVIVIDS